MTGGGPWNKSEIRAAILAFLAQHQGPVTEYQLIQHLSEGGFFAAFTGDSKQLQLFKKHFITRHCLYTLRQDFAPDGCLLIGPLTIQLQQGSPAMATGSELGPVDAALQGYYLDLNHLEQADEESVHELLQKFWRTLGTWNINESAFQVLDLPPDADWEQVQQAYRRKIQRAHPDMGGDPETAARISEAYRILKARFKF